MSLQRGYLGWNIAKENQDDLYLKGQDPELMMSVYADQFPAWNYNAEPTAVYKILDQGPVGSCQGNALAGVFSVCYYLQTGRWLDFSRACGYYVAQNYDGIRGDQGSTLNGGRRVATEHGMCLESDWPYVPRYSPSKPAGIQFKYKLKQSKPITDVSTMLSWLELGLPIQTGLLWNDFCDKEVVTNWRSTGRDGGHSTLFWQLRNSGNICNLNSWGKGWNGDGVHEFATAAIEQMLRNKFTVFIGYAPDGMEYVEPEPI